MCYEGVKRHLKEFDQYIQTFINYDGSYKHQTGGHFSGVAFMGYF